jgi:hypothetical protein
MVKPPAKQYTDLVESVFDVVVAVIGPGAEEHKGVWQWAVHELASVSFEFAKLAAKEALGEGFVAVAEDNARKALPKSD